jgi:hypothetical protein
MNSMGIHNPFGIYGLVILNNGVDAIPIPDSTTPTNHFVVGFGTWLVKNIILNQAIFSSDR